MTFIRLTNSKALGSVDPSDPVLPAAEAAAWFEASQLLDHAREEAAQLIGSARQQLEAERARGYQQGLEEARLELTERMIETASRTVELFASIEQRMVSLVMDAVRRLMADFSDSERVMAVVRSALSVLRNQRQLTLRIAPDHVEHVRARASELLEQFPGVGILDIVADPRLKHDAAILESEIGLVEASIESQLQAIEQGFQKVLGSRV
jgi:type III secretion protein L